MKNLFLPIIATLIIACSKEQPVTLSDKHITEINNYLEALEGFSGAVLIAKNDSVLYKKAFGYAHIGHQVKNNTNTKFSYASVGKSFTAVAIFQLIEAGKLSLDDPIGKFFPDYPNEEAREAITIRLLLSHRSGLPNYFRSEKYINTSKEQFRTLESITPLYENEPLEFRPNEQFAYRNTNYIMLGRIIEAVTQLPYANYIEEHIFSVAKMKNTGNFDADHPTPNAAEHYTLSDVYPNKLQKTLFMSGVKGSPAGGGRSTIDDLFNFATSFKHNQLLSSTYTDLMKKEPESGSYGYGMQFSGGKGSGVYGHSGGHFGVGAEWRIFGKQDYTVVLLTNKDLGEGFLDARFFIEKTISGATPKLESYFFTKDVINAYLKDGITTAEKLIAASEINLSELDINSKGYEMINRGFYKKAIDLFKLEVYAFPDSYDAYDSLAEAYMMNGDTEKAIEYYEKSLELNPENNNAKEKLKTLSVS